jgi:hypothetical protein
MWTKQVHNFWEGDIMASEYQGMPHQGPARERAASGGAPFRPPVVPDELDELEMPNLSSAPAPVVDEPGAKQRQDEPAKSPVAPPPQTGGKLRGSLGWIAAGGGAALLVVAGFLALFRSPVPAHNETVYTNWSRYVEPVTNRWQHGDKVVELVNAGGQVRFLTELPLVDRDPKTTQAVQQALQQGDDQKLQQVLDAAQNIPTLNDAKGQPLPRKELQVTPELKQTLLSQKPEFFRLTLFDSCDEDGDAVEVLVNGQSFAVVPLTQKGATLSIPVPPGTTRIALKGVADGIGGITVGGRSSAGDLFWGVMKVGEVQELAAIAR